MRVFVLRKAVGDDSGNNFAVFASTNYEKVEAKLEEVRLDHPYEDGDWKRRTVDYWENYEAEMALYIETLEVHDD